MSTVGWLQVNHYLGNLGRIDIRIRHQPLPPGNGQAQNWLLVGSDTRAGQRAAYNAPPGSADYVTGGRSDTQLLVHVPAGNGKITVVSFPRDSWVQIPAYGNVPAHYGKINSAYSEGKAPLLVQTIENLSGLRIDHYMEIDFGGFKNMVNALGGLTICVQTPRNEPLSGDVLPAGVSHINGDQALAFVRDRHTFADEDISRIKDQQYFLSTMLRKVLSVGVLSNPFTLNRFLNALTKSVTVDNTLSLAAMKNFAERMRHLDPAHVTFTTLPYVTANGFIDGQSVVELDPVKDAALFAALRQSQPAAPAGGRRTTASQPLIVPPSAISVQVENGTSTAGLAHRAANDLSRVGFAVASVGNSATATGTASIVYYGPTRTDSARTLAAAVPGAILRPDPSLGSTVVLVVGSGYSGAHTVSVQSGAPSSATPAPSPTATTAANLSCAP